MKTAISVPDDVFELSDRLAKKLKISRSAVFSLGLRKLGEEMAEVDEAELVARINDVCAEVDTSVEPRIKDYQAERLRRKKW